MRDADTLARRNRRRARARGIIAALLAATVACVGDPSSPAPVLRLQLTPETSALSAGDIVRVTAVAVDEDGREVRIGSVTLTTDDPSVAAIDAASRLRAVSPGRTFLRGVADGVVGSVEVQVLAGPASFVLERYERGDLPVIVAADSVDWSGAREYHEVFAVSGALALVGGGRPRYELLIRYEEYAVRYAGDVRSAELRLRWSEYDRGTIEYDAAGDLEMTSEIIAPLSHRSSSVAGGFVVDYRIPGSDERLELFYRR